MRNVILLMLGLGGLLLAVVSSAEEYSIVEGNVTDAATGESVALTGSLELDPIGTPLSDGTTLHRIDDFELNAGDQMFLPRLPVEYNGKVPLILLLQFADQIYLASDRVNGFRLRAGGDLVEVNGDEVTFRFFDFRSTSAAGSSVSSHFPGSPLPRRFHLEGTLYQVDETYRVNEGTCLPILIPPPTTPPGGGVIIIGENLILHSLEVFDLSLSETAQFIPPLGGTVLTRVTGGSQSSIHGSISISPRSGDVFILNPTGVSFSDSRVINVFDDVAITVQPIFATSEHPVPTLEELSISAPNGAMISFENGLLSVESDGDLTLFGPIPELDGLTALRIATSGSIFVLEDFEVPQLLTVVFNAGGSIEIDGDIHPPDTIPPCDVVSLDGLFPVLPFEETELGSFTLTASSATQVEIDVLPWRDPNRLRLGTHQWVSVAILGSDDFDVRDINPDTLRLGPAEGEPLSRHGRPFVWIFDVDRTRPRHRDLFTIFDLRNLGVSYTDTELCLSAQTYGGETIEGCDEIDAMPRIRPNAHHRRHHRGRHQQHH